jgi:arylamine N-acetyltransferase
MVTTLTSEQVHRYLERISLEPTNHPPDRSYLNVLIRGQLASIPYENLSIHYSQTNKICLDIPSLYDKIVLKRQGGYCMELNNLFGALLIAVGYDVHARAGRVWKVGSPAGSDGELNANNWTGWSHMILIVRLEGVEYFVDVGFGANGPVQAIQVPPLSSLSAVVPGVIPEQHQIGSIKVPHSPSETTYIIRHRRDPDSEWIPLFCFDPFTPFFSSDYEVMSFYCHCHPISPFVNNVLCTTVAFDGDKAIKRLMLQNNVLKERKDGQNTIVEKFDHEEARTKSIERVWGIRFTDEEKKGLQKWGLEIKGPEKEKGVPIAGWS